MEQSGLFVVPEPVPPMTPVDRVPRALSATRRKRLASAFVSITQGQHWQPIRDPFELTSPAQHALRRVISFWNFLA